MNDINSLCYVIAPKLGQQFQNSLRSPHPKVYPFQIFKMFPRSNLVLRNDTRPLSRPLIHKVLAHHWSQPFIDFRFCFMVNTQCTERGHCRDFRIPQPRRHRSIEHLTPHRLLHCRHLHISDSSNTSSMSKSILAQVKELIPPLNAGLHKGQAGVLHSSIRYSV